MIAIAILAVTFLAGAFAGLLVLLRLATVREERKPFSIQAQTQVTAASRLVTGLYVRRPQPIEQAGYVTARVVPDQDRPHAVIPGTGRQATGQTVLPAITNPARNTNQTEARSRQWRNR